VVYRKPAPGSASPPPGHSGNEGWSIFGYLLSGMLVYGGLGWLVSRWAHVSLLFPAGMLIGLGLGVLLIILKYGRS
jgi:ATP synthase protein I